MRLLGVFVHFFDFLNRELLFNGAASSQEDLSRERLRSAKGIIYEQRTGVVRILTEVGQFVMRNRHLVDLISERLNGIELTHLLDVLVVLLVKELSVVHESGIALDLQSAGQRQGIESGCGRTRHPYDDVLSDCEVEVDREEGVHGEHLHLLNQLLVQVDFHEEHLLAHRNSVAFSLGVALLSAHLRLDQPRLPDDLDARGRIQSRHQHFRDVAQVALLALHDLALLVQELFLWEFDTVAELARPSDAGNCSAHVLQRRLKGRLLRDSLGARRCVSSQDRRCLDEVASQAGLR